MPKYAPYVWVRRTTRDTIIVELMDPNANELVPATGYTVYYFGYRLGANSSLA